MANITLTNDTTNSIWTYSPEITKQSGNKLVLNTKDKFLDKNIEITPTVVSGTITGGINQQYLRTYFTNDGASSDDYDLFLQGGHRVTTAGYVDVTTGFVLSGAQNFFKIKKVVGSIEGTASACKATAAIKNTNSMANTTTTKPTGTAGTDYWEVKATATGTAGSYTPKYTVTTAGWIDSTVDGSAQTVNVTSDTTGKSIYIKKAIGSTTCAGGGLTWTNGNATIVNSSTTGVAIKVARAAVIATSKITTAGYTPTNTSFSTDSIEEVEETKYITGVELVNGNAFNITVPNGDNGTVTFHFSVANGNTTITST